MGIQLLLAALAALARQRSQTDIADYLELGGELTLLVQNGRTEVKAELDALRAEIEGMVAAGRDPSPAERAAVRDRRHELSDQIRALGVDVTSSDDDPPAD